MTSREPIPPSAGNPAAGADASENVAEHIDEIRGKTDRAFVLVFAFAAAWAGAVAGWLMWRLRQWRKN